MIFGFISGMVQSVFIEHVVSFNPSSHHPLFINKNLS